MKKLFFLAIIMQSILTFFAFGMEEEEPEGAILSPLKNADTIIRFLNGPFDKIEFINTEQFPFLAREANRVEFFLRFRSLEHAVTYNSVTEKYVLDCNKLWHEELNSPEKSVSRNAGGTQYMLYGSILGGTALTCFILGRYSK